MFVGAAETHLGQLQLHECVEISLRPSSGVPGGGVSGGLLHGAAYTMARQSVATSERQYKLSPSYFTAKILFQAI